MTPAIQVERLTKRYGRLTAVSDLTLEVAAGEVVGFLGPNGAGKTTTIRTVMGFLRPTEGNARVLGSVLASSARLKRQVGYLPGDFRADGAMTADQLFSWFAGLRGMRYRQRIVELAERLGLDRSRPFAQLSKGNRQKVGLVQAFMHDPDVLILDEPTSGLDPLVQREFLAMTREAAARGAAVLFSSHVLPEVARIADRVGIINQGRLVTLASVDELLSMARRSLDLHFAGTPPEGPLRAAQGVVSVQVDGRSATVVVDGPVGPALQAATANGLVLRIDTVGDELEDVFISLLSPPPETTA